MPTLAERKAALLDAAMLLSKRRQDLAVEIQQVEQEQFKTAGALDLVDAMIAEKPHGE